MYVYRDEIYSLQILLSRTQARPGRTVKQEQEEISPNHVQRLNLISVLSLSSPLQNINDERVFIVLYAISAVYFAGVMVRLMLTLTPCVCILAAIAFSKLFSIYLKEDEAAKEAEDPETSEKNGRLYDKVIVGKYFC